MTRMTMLRAPLLLLFLTITTLLQGRVSSLNTDDEEKHQLRRVQGSTTIDFNADCVLADSSGVNHFFDNGESFGTIAPHPCGACYCDTTQANKIRCPYCIFPTVTGGFACARDNGSVTFNDPFGVQRTCTCDYMSGTNFDSNCPSPTGPGFASAPVSSPVVPTTPRPVPRPTYPPAPAPVRVPTFVPVPTMPTSSVLPPAASPVAAAVVPSGFVCPLTRNTEKCAALTVGMSYNASCPCMTFCLGNLVSCCQPGAACSYSCSGGSSSDVAAGCQVNPYAVVVAPTQAPRTPTRPPVAPTRTPVAPTRQPVRPTRQPVMPTRQPAVPSRPPAVPTRLPTVPTRQPVNPTRQPSPSSSSSNRVCLYERNTNKCAALTEGIAYSPSCPCMNFCLGGFAGCCAAGALCVLECPGAGSSDVVAGCHIPAYRVDALPANTAAVPVSGPTTLSAPSTP